MKKIIVFQATIFILFCGIILSLGASLEQGAYASTDGFEYEGEELSAGGGAGGGVKVAMINVNRVVNESEAGKAAKKKMEARYEELKKTIGGKQEEALKIKEEIDKQKVMLGKEKLKEKENALQAKINELRQLTHEGEREMQTLQGERTREVLKQVEVQIDRAVAEEEIDLVLDETQGDRVIYYNHKLKAMILTATGVDIGSFQIKEREGMIRKYLATNADFVGKNPFETHPDLDITAKVMKMVDEETRRGK